MRCATRRGTFLKHRPARLVRPACDNAAPMHSGPCATVAVGETALGLMVTADSCCSGSSTCRRCCRGEGGVSAAAYLR